MFTGSARAKNPREHTGHFMVNFGNVKGDYIVLGTDYDSYALVGGSTPDMLWVLKRPGTMMSEPMYKSMVRKARSMGYDVDRLKIATYQ